MENLTKSFGDLVLFENISLGLSEGQRVGLIAKNGSGKTTLLNILSGKEGYDSGTISFRRDLRVGYLEQDPQYPEELTVLEACFHHGNSTVELIKEYERCMETEGHPGLDEILVRMDHEKAWEYEQKAKQILSQLKIRDFSQHVKYLSGGQLKRVALANTLITEPDLLILDEPTNHLDIESIQWLEEFLINNGKAVIVISHDRTLLNLLPAICELSSQGLTYYSGNYDFYKEQKTLQQNALTQQLEEKQKALRLARKVAREVEERKAKQNVRGEKASIKKGIPRILMGGLKNNAENSSSRLSSIHAEKAEKLQTEMAGIKSSLSQTDKLKTDFNASHLHTGKILVTARDVNFHYPNYPNHTASPAETPHTETTAKSLWASPLTFQLRSGDRLSLKGKNGSGKTTLLNVISTIDTFKCRGYLCASREYLHKERKTTGCFS